MSEEMLSPSFLRSLCDIVKDFKKQNPGVLEAMTEERNRRGAETAKEEAKKG